MAVLDIPEGCILVGPRNSRFFIFSNRLLIILHAMYLNSNKVALNQAKITVFLHTLYNYLRTCHPSSPKFELLKFVWPGRWEKSVKYLPNCSEGVQCYLEFEVFDTFSVFMLCRMSSKSILPPKMANQGNYQIKYYAQIMSASTHNTPYGPYADLVS